MTVVFYLICGFAIRGFLGFFRCGRNYIFGAFVYWIKNAHSIFLVWTVNCCEIRTWTKVFFCSFVLHFCTCLTYGPVTFTISQFPSFRGTCVLLWFDMTVVKPSPQGGKENIKPTTGIDSDPPDEDIAVTATCVQISLDGFIFLWYATAIRVNSKCTKIYTHAWPFCYHRRNSIQSMCMGIVNISRHRSKTSFKVHMKSFVK